MFPFPIATLTLGALRAVNAFTSAQEMQVETMRLEANRRIEEHNRKYSIAPHEYSRLFSWAIGEKTYSQLMYRDKYGLFIDQQDCYSCIINKWNEKHGNTLTLYIENSIEHNMQQISNLWINLGKP